MIKHKLYLVSILTLALTSVFAQKSVNRLDENGKRHGFWTKNYHKTNQKRYEGYFNHGKEVDTFNYYTLHKGKSVLSATKVFNKMDSIANVTFFASNKKVISKGKMNGKRFIGEWIYYHKNATAKMIVEHYNDNGKLHGKRNVIYKNGVIAEHANYKDGNLNGEAKWFSEDNKLIKIANYKDGEFHGKYISYNSSGTKTSEGNYINDKKSGIWFYFEDGKEKTIDYSKAVGKSKRQ
ncbi:MAG: toxin-antitoxin system YwqK family antitoxin [Winogradskyella sp.]